MEHMQPCYILLFHSDEADKNSLLEEVQKSYALVDINSTRELFYMYRNQENIDTGLLITDLQDEDEIDQIFETLSDFDVYLIADYPFEPENDNGNSIAHFSSIYDCLSYLSIQAPDTHMEPPPMETGEHGLPDNVSPIVPTQTMQVENGQVATDPENADNGSALTDLPEWDDIEESIETITEYKAIQREKLGTTSSVDGKEPVLESSQKKGTEGVVYKENPYYLRSRNLQKQLFTRQQWDEHKMIGVWSPLHRMGVTSLTINFAFFLAQNRIYTAVLEGLTAQHAMKDWLKRYTPIPQNWSSYANAIQTDATNTLDTEWKYKNVLFLPLDQKDSHYVWNSPSLESYMSATKIIDVTLVDLPTGEMANYTTASLHYLDELWIVVDDAIQETLAWKSYIQNLREQVDIPFHLIFNKHYLFSQDKRIEKEMGIPIITCMPALHKETMQNYYENVPLYFKQETHEKMQEPFIDLAKHLFSGDFTIAGTELFNKHGKWTDRILRPLRTRFAPLKDN